MYVKDKSKEMTREPYLTEGRHVRSANFCWATASVGNPTNEDALDLALHAAVRALVARLAHLKQIYKMLIQGTVKV